MKRLAGLYLITDSDQDGKLLSRVKSALKGGTRIVQYRDKSLPREAQIEMAIKVRDLCHKYAATFLINDDPAMALTCEADGVHIGQSDGSVSEARKLLGHQRLIGVSTRTVEQALKAEMQGADYVAVGSMFPTETKQDAVHVGIDTLSKVRRAVEVPVVAIGGLNRDRASEALDAGADAVAVISAVMGSATPEISAREIALLFNRRTPFPRGRVLTVAGSDSGGGAGIQADLKTVSLLGSYGSSVITALTAQNTRGVSGIFPIEPEFVGEQLHAVLTDIGTDIVKTGMLLSAEIVAMVAQSIRRHSLMAVVDPVMIAKGGASLLQQDAVEIFRIELLPQTYLLTPNLPEAEVLTGTPVKTEADMEQAARKLQQMGARNVLLKGGHLEGEAVDLLLEGDNLHRFAAPRIDTRNTHGTGCTFSAAIAAFLARGLPLTAAVGAAKNFINQAISTAPAIGGGHGPVNHWQGAKAVISDQ